MHQVLLVEDSVEYVLLVPATLGADYRVSVGKSLEEARTLLKDKDFDLILLDVVLPDGLGFDFYSEIRQMKGDNCPPIVFLSGRSEVEDRVKGWSLGAEDYITKPFNASEFQIRIKNRVESFKSKRTSGTVIKWSLLTLDLGQHMVTLNENGKLRKVDLTPIEFKLLHHMMKHAENVLSRQQLIDAVWGNEIHITERTVDKHISTLRTKLGTEEVIVKSIAGAGYMLTHGYRR